MWVCAAYCYCYCVCVCNAIRFIVTANLRISSQIMRFTCANTTPRAAHICTTLHWSTQSVRAFLHLHIMCVCERLRFVETFHCSPFKGDEVNVERYVATLDWQNGCGNLKNIFLSTGVYLFWFFFLQINSRAKGKCINFQCRKRISLIV